MCILCGQSDCHCTSALHQHQQLSKPAQDIFCLHTTHNNCFTNYEYLTKARFPLPELTARELWCIFWHPSTRAVNSGVKKCTRVHGLWTRAMNSGSGNRALVTRAMIKMFYDYYCYEYHDIYAQIINRIIKQLSSQSSTTYHCGT